MFDKKQKKIKILVTDDHPIVRDGLEHLLNREKDIEVCGLAENATETMELLQKEKPNFLIIDISLKGGVSGIELTGAISNIHPNLPILILSMHDESLYAERAIRAGAKGYIMKHEMTDTIVTAIRQIMNGDIYLSKNMTSTILKELIQKQPKPDNPVEALTNRELEVFLLVGQGFKSNEIGLELNLSRKTIDTYKQRLKTKLSLKNSTELTKTAIDWHHKSGKFSS